MTPKRTDCEECIERAQIYLDHAVPVERRVKDPAAFVETVTKVANLTHRYHLIAAQCNENEATKNEPRPTLPHAD